jgi:hypothetical protein
MSTLVPYGRRVRVVVGPFTEDLGGRKITRSIEMFGDGSQVGFRIKFNVPKHVYSTAAPTVVSIYNLPQGMKAALADSSELQVSLYVGWYNTEETLLASGTLLNFVSHRQGPDIITDLIFNPFWSGIMRTMALETYAGGLSVKNVILQLAAKVAGVTVDPRNVIINLEKKIGSQGISFPGNINDALDSLSRVYGFSWRIENKVFYAIEHGSSLTVGKHLISAENGSLIKAEPMLATPMQGPKGVQITSLLNPYIIPGGIIELQSSINQVILRKNYDSLKVNRDYVVHGLKHAGDTHVKTWQTEITSFVVLDSADTQQGMF